MKADMATIATKSRNSLRGLAARSELRGTMSSPVRSVFYLGVAASLLLSFAQAPFQHLHRSDPLHVSSKSFGHAHWNSNSASDAAWNADDSDSDALMLNWLAGDGNGPAKFVVAIQESPAQVVLTVQGVRIPDLTPDGHDPPRLVIRSPRAPPA